MADSLGAPPILSTPDTRIFEEPIPTLQEVGNERPSDEQILAIYEMERTVREIKASKWRRIALQFPDSMLPDAPRVYEALRRSLHTLNRPATRSEDNTEVVRDRSGLSDHLAELSVQNAYPLEELYILADTSYGACCVDEIAAEHVDADVVVHYGRSCLSPTSRLPVIYVFTSQTLSIDRVVESFKSVFPERDDKVIVMADATFSNHIPSLYESLLNSGYHNICKTSISHDPSAQIPNRSVCDASGKQIEDISSFSLFHISDPPESLLLTLSSRVKEVFICPTDSEKLETGIGGNSMTASTAAVLRRRYALVTRLKTAAIFGILINTLSVKNYLHIVDRVRSQISAAGKKSYIFVVGKVNAAKVANFSEIEGWVVIGCWETSLIDSKDFWRPIITPFELSIALQNDDKRIWTGEWASDFENILQKSEPEASIGETNGGVHESDGERIGRYLEEDEPESAPPEFDFRTGKYVSSSRPMAPRGLENRSLSPSASSKKAESSSLIKRANGDVATIGGQISPAAEYLRTQRTWIGLGSDFEVSYEGEANLAGTTIEEGRSGIARGYVVGNADDKR